MPKELSARRFRKGTKSCVECRQRKLRCIPAADDSQPCQNCEARGRQCVLQVHVGRNSESTGITSRDRISQLEDNVEGLWTIVQELRTELGHGHSETAHSDGAHIRRSTADAESESEGSDTSPINPPPHLQQLFDNEFLDSRGNDSLSSDIGSDKASTALLARARSRLQALMPPKEDVRAILTPAAKWFALYNSIFPTINVFTGATEMLARYEALQEPGANPIAVASLLISITMTLVQRSSEAPSQYSGIKDVAAFSRKVTETVEETIVLNDTLAGTVDGIETTLLYIRLQLVQAQTRKIWLMLRRCIALAELIGLPRAAQRVELPETLSPSNTDFLRTASKLESAALLWKGICSIDRVVGMMFNLPPGTAAYPFPLPQRIIADGELIPQNYLRHLANICSKVQEVDEAYISQLPETELLEKVFKADQELRSLSNMTPQGWWTLTPDTPLPDRLLQYWYHYFTVRTHLQLALRNSSDSQYTYSYLACSQAARAMAERYVNLRGILPPGFFAGRILDLQALTAAVFLMYNSQRPVPKQGISVQDEGDKPSTVLVEQIIQMMDSVSTQASGDFSRQAVSAIRGLRELLNRPGQAASQNLTLRIPMLGKINVNRHSQPNQSSQSLAPYDTAQLGGAQPYFAPPQTASTDAQNAALGFTSLDSNDLLSWSMDLMQDDFAPFPDESFGADQWLSFNGFNANGQAQG